MRTIASQGHAGQRRRGSGRLRKIGGWWASVSRTLLRHLFITLAHTLPISDIVSLIDTDICMHPAARVPGFLFPAAGILRFGDDFHSPRLWLSTE